MRMSTRYLFAVLCVMALVSMGMMGCSDRIKGDKIGNQKPVVFFVNIPPDGSKVSVNPVVFWVGSDIDGLVKYFRYIVVPETEMNNMGPDEYARLVLENPNDTSEWSDPDSVKTYDPATTNEIPASADLSGDPVNRFIRQYIFVRAWDDLGLGSDVVFRLVLRNDFPPDTEIRGKNGLTTASYINGLDPACETVDQSIVTGVPIRWQGSDPDLEDSLFEFQWRLFGPYDTATFNAIMNTFIDTVIVTRDAKIFDPSSGDTISIFDTTYDSTGLIVDTTYILLDTVVSSGFYLTIDTNYFNMDAFLDSSVFVDTNPTDSIDDPFWRKAAIQLQNSDSIRDPLSCEMVYDEEHRGWITNTRDTLYQLFPTDGTGPTNTVVRKFIFWIQSRDQAEVADLTPDWTTFEAIEPKYERDILVIDFSKTLLRWNAPYADTSQRDFQGNPVVTPQMYWDTVINRWNPTIGQNFDIDQDYILVDRAALRVSLKQLLSHNLAIIYNDDIEASGISSAGVPTSNLGVNIYTAIDAGVNAWVVMRAPITGGKGQGPAVGSPGLVIPDDDYSRYFGVSEMVFSGWGFHAFDQTRWSPPPSSKRLMVRIEDFVGAVVPDDPDLFWFGLPDLEIDTNLLHSRYKWSEAFEDPFDSFGWGTPFRWGGGFWPQLPLPDDLRCLPEVNWASRTFGTNLMYLYNSYYGRKGASHFFGEFYTFQGTPVAHTRDAGVYQTAHFCFTPLAIDSINMQIVINRTLTYLWNPNRQSAAPMVRYNEGRNQVRVPVARREYFERIERQARENEAYGVSGSPFHK